MNVDDIQGVVLRGFRSYSSIRHFLFHITDVKAAQAFLGRLAPGSGAPVTVTPGTVWKAGEKPAYCLNVGISNSGLRKLIGETNYTAVQTDSFGLFAPFDAGAADPNVARAVGDSDGTPSAPANWWKNGGWKLSGQEPSTALLDILITLYTPPADNSRDKFSEALLAMGAPGVVPAFILDCDPLDPPDSIHFGYVDGISQPRIAGYADDSGDPLDDAPVPSYYFVIDPNPSGPAPYTAHPLLGNGCFGAFRMLHQDVAAFNAFLAQAGSESDLLAAKMCGRWRDGTPLEVRPDGPDPTLTPAQRVNFNYLSASAHQLDPPTAPTVDGDGSRCPYASHTRRTNPRDDVKVKPFDPPFPEHRVMRRAFAYGPTFESNPAAERGLAGLFMGASLQDQFVFLMQTWVQAGFFRDPNDASPNHSGVDPLFGPQPDQASTDFAYLGSDGQYKTVGGLTRFVRTDGGLFVFLPSITALGWLAKGNIPPGN
jgi:Dyp-type peroxidase family